MSCQRHRPTAVVAVATARLHSTLTLPRRGKAAAKAGRGQGGAQPGGGDRNWTVTVAGWVRLDGAGATGRGRGN